MKTWKGRLSRIRPGTLVILGFLAAIVLGTGLLMLPISRRPGIVLPPVDALFTATSAVCVTGLLAVDTADTFSVFGCAVIALLIQVGGLGVSSLGVGVILLMHRHVGFRERRLVQEGLNLQAPGGAVRLVRSVLALTLCVEGIGAALCFISFSRDHPPLAALGISLFHAIASFNNAGFDVLGGMTNLAPYRSDVLLVLVTSAMIILGGLGFLVVSDVLRERRFRRLSLHAKIVLTMTALLLALGTLVLRATEGLPWLGAFFTSVSARTAGFSTYPLGSFSHAGLFATVMLMFIGASPGSTGGGIKTTTFFSILVATYAIAATKHPTAFRRSIPQAALQKAFVVAMLSLGVCCAAAFLLCVLEPQLALEPLLFEAVSAFATVGLSTGITPTLSAASKLALTAVMFTGRLGPLAIASLLTFRQLPRVRYSEEPIPIG